MVFSEMWPSSTRVLDAMIKWPGSEEPSHTGFAIANGFENGTLFFGTLGRSAERSERFADAMLFLRCSLPFHSCHLLDNLDWDDRIYPRLMVDIGGSRGSIAVEILRKYPTVHCIVQGLAEVMSSSEVPAELRHRLSYQEHNFFLPRVVVGADVYFMRSVLHDWSDKYAIQILRNLIPGLKNGSRVLLNEICLPERGKISRYQDQMLR
jgi:hypothetical protein